MSQKLDSGLQVEHFTKEFPGYEIESKWELRYLSPVAALLRFREDITAGKWGNFRVTKTMGALKTGIRLLEYNFHFFGVNEGGSWQQVAMVAEDSMGFYMVAFKNEGKKLFPNLIEHAPLVREETRKCDWISLQEMSQKLRAVFPNASYVGTMHRQKVFIYITNLASLRNFNISADLCFAPNRSPLSQVELEYKGRSGIWLPDTVGLEILEDFKTLHKIFAELYSDILVPTFTKKFNWILGTGEN